MTTGFAIVLSLAVGAGGAAAQDPGDRPAVTEQVYAGWKYFQVHCARCHGYDALGNGVLMAAPDLAYSVSEEGRMTADAFTEFVRGLPGHAEAPIDALYQYLRARSDGSLEPGRPRRAPTTP